MRRVLLRGSLRRFVFLDGETRTEDVHFSVDCVSGLSGLGVGSRRRASCGSVISVMKICKITLYDNQSENAVARKREGASRSGSL